MKLAVLLLLFCFHGNLFAESAPLDKVDVVHYAFDLELSDSTDAISAKADITLLFKQNANSFSLDLTSLTDGKGMRVSSVLSARQKLVFSHEGNVLRITLPEIQSAGTQITVSIQYGGVPADGLVIGKNKYGDRTFFGDNWPDRAHHWLPVVDHPSDKASVEFRVTAPAHYEVIGNGIRVEESALQNNRKFTHWRETVPIATKVMVIGAARFAIYYAGEVDNIPVEQWVYPQNRKEGFGDFAEATKILEFFIKQVGPYPYRKLANVQSKTRYGGMENASNIFYTESAVNGKADHRDLIAHEVAHQWFGNSATEVSWEHVWLSEGFATYMTNVYNEFTYGDSVRRTKMAQQRDDVLKFYEKSKLPLVFKTLPSNLLEILSSNSYQKGSWVLHMLRKEIGEDAFWNGIRQYYKEYGGRNASTADFQKVMQGQTERNLDGFFRQWVYTPGHPVIKASFTSANGPLVVSVEQVQETAFTFPLEIGFFSAEGKLLEIQKITVMEKTAKFTLKSAFKPAAMILDPNKNLLWKNALTSEF
jgi:aminopeptidase N